MLRASSFDDDPKRLYVGRLAGRIRRRLGYRLAPIPERFSTGVFVAKGLHRAVLFGIREAGSANLRRDNRKVVDDASDAFLRLCGGERAEYVPSSCPLMVVAWAEHLIFARRLLSRMRQSWSSFFGHRERLIDCRLLLEGIGWRVAQFGVQLYAVVEGHEVVGDVAHGLGVIG